MTCDVRPIHHCESSPPEDWGISDNPTGDSYQPR